MADGPDPGHMVRFCHEILPKLLVEACDVAAPDAARVAEDILLRAEAAARLDRISCEILAAPFFEESFSHEPDEAPAWMKAITTLVIRNAKPADHLETPSDAFTGVVFSGIEVWVRRHELIKPESEYPMNGFRDLSGLSGSHRKTVESYVHHVTQVKA